MCVYTSYNEPGKALHYRFVEQQVAVPLEIKTPEITDHILKVSPSFVQVYHQALATEQLRLTQVTGIALRKSIEYLIKDYAVSQNPSELPVIEKKPLAQCINDYIKDHYLRETAKRATWLGNDEAHYSRVWQDFDVQDLKRLIHLTLAWLNYALLTEEYLKNMPDKETK